MDSLGTPWGVHRRWPPPRMAVSPMADSRTKKFLVSDAMGRAKDLTVGVVDHEVTLTTPFPGTARLSALQALDISRALADAASDLTRGQA